MNKSESPEASAFYSIQIWGKSFDPDKLKWPDSIFIEDIRVPNALYSYRGGEPTIAEDGYVALQHRHEIDEAELFTLSDPLILFLILNRKALGKAGAEECRCFMHVYRVRTLACSLSLMQLENLARAGVDLRIEFEVEGVEGE